MTNILLLPQIDGSQTSFAITTNSDWIDSIFFTAPGSPQAPVTAVGAIASGTNTVTVASTVNLIPGLPIVAVPGIPAGTYVGAIPTATQFTMVNLDGGAVNATITDAETNLTFEPLPLDLTGIRFVADLRIKAGGTERFLQVSTDDGTLRNGGAAGTLSFVVPQGLLAKLRPQTYALDIVATADNTTINLLQEGPASVEVADGVTVL